MMDPRPGAPTGGAPRPLWKRLLRRPFMTARRAAEIGVGFAYVSPLFQTLRARRLGTTEVSPVLRTATLAHVYYPEFWPEIRALHATLPEGSPLIVTAPAGQAARIAELAAGDPLVEIVEVPNRGRDIAPFLHVLRSGRLDRFDAVLKIHTKRSPHMRQGDLRRRVLFAALAGSPEVTAAILGQFKETQVGIVGPGSLFRAAPVYWMANRTRVEALAARMGGVPRLGFFEGSMFWLRPSALAPLRALGLRAEDFQEETGQTDGTLHHAVERAFPIAAAAAGFETRSLGGQALVGSELPPLAKTLADLALPAKAFERAYDGR